MAPVDLGGSLLVATPLIADGHFERTVVLLLAHGPEGAFGVVLNRPSDVPAGELVPAWGERTIEPGVMFLGGPVAPNAVIGLHRGGAVDLNTAPDDTVDPPSEVRLFAGSAGWGSGQLEMELAERAWWVVDAGPDDAFTGDPSGLWRRVLRRQPGPTAWFANYPEDLGVN